ncbi:MAG: DNA gyrase inhibitor YacG [Xanthobacteraceae bacterium]
MTGSKDATAKPCVICGKPADERFKPFCSRRCANVDLNRWLSGAYAIPTAEAPDDEEERPAKPDRDTD